MTTRIGITVEAADRGTLMTVLQTGFPNEEMRNATTEGRVRAPARLETYLTGSA